MYVWIYFHYYFIFVIIYIYIYISYSIEYEYSLVLPLVSRQTVNIMQSGHNLTDTMELSTFAFLYGTFPAAPGAFVIAAHYNINVNLVNI